MSQFIIRAYSPVGLYPNNSIVNSDAALIQHEDLFFSIVKFFQENPNEYYPEREWLYPVEIKFLSSIVLSIPRKTGKVYSYPDALGYKMSLNKSDELTNDETINEIKTNLIERIEKRDSNFWNIVPLGPKFNGPSYRIHENVEITEYQSKIFSLIDLSDHLLIRGLGALIKGDLLNLFHIFHTEACISLHIAMEASMYLIFRRLKEQGEKATPEKASVYISNVFGNDTPPKKYFEDFYEDRIKAVHPESRYGTYPDAPLAVDDFYDLFTHLKSVYEYLVTGNIDET